MRRTRRDSSRNLLQAWGRDPGEHHPETHADSHCSCRTQLKESRKGKREQHGHRDRQEQHEDDQSPADQNIPGTATKQDWNLKYTMHTTAYANDVGKIKSTMMSKKSNQNGT